MVDLWSFLRTLKRNPDMEPGWAQEDISPHLGGVEGVATDAAAAGGWVWTAGGRRVEAGGWGERELFSICFFFLCWLGLTGFVPNLSSSSRTRDWAMDNGYHNPKPITHIFPYHFPSAHPKATMGRGLWTYTLHLAECPSPAVVLTIGIIT